MVAKVARDPEPGSLASTCTVPLDVLAGEGLLRAEGDPALIARFLTLFPLPERVELPPE